MTAELAAAAEPYFWPAFIQTVLTLALGLWAGFSRSHAISTGATKGRELRAGQPNWPGRTAQISGAFNNQFETPIYFFAGLGFAIALQAPQAIVLPLAWIYVASRLAHAAVYVSVNIVPVRFVIFLAGFSACGAIWGVIAWRLLSASAS